MSEIILNGYGRFDRRMRIVVEKFEVFVFEVEDAIDAWIDVHLRDNTRRSAELQLRLFKVIRIKMSVTKSVDEIAQRQTCHLCNHHRQRSIRRDVEWDTKKDIGTALVKLAREPIIRNVELKQQVARRKCHPRDFANVPRRHN